jgi:hypothetical protein
MKVLNLFPLYFISSLLLLSAVYDLDAADEICDPSVLSIEGKLGYQARDNNRCEGLYEARTSSEFELLSFVRKKGASAIDALSEIKVLIPNFTHSVGNIISIRVRALHQKAYYQLDAQASPGNSFSWPTTSVLDKVGLSIQDLGFLAWFPDPRGRVILPLQLLDGKGETGIGDKASFVVRSPLPLEWMKWRIYPEQGTQKVAVSWKDAGMRMIAPGQPIHVEVPLGNDGNIKIIDVYAKPVKRDTPERLSVRILD